MTRKPIFLALLIAAPASAQSFQNIPALQARLEAALGAGVGEPGGPAAPIDMRLKLQPCPTSVQIDPPVMGAVALRCPAIGWRIRVPLQRLGNGGFTGQQATAVQAVIKRGDPVDLVAGDGGFSVSVTGIAQEDGVPGARIRIKTEGDGRSQGQIIFGEVLDSGRVRLPGFN